MRRLTSWTVVAALLSTACGGSESPEECDERCIEQLAPVKQLAATAGVGEVELAWTIPDGASGVTIRRSPDDFPREPTDGEAIYDGDALSYTDTSAQNFTAYYYAAFATDAAGNFSDGPATAQAMPTFDEVAMLSAAAQPGEVRLTWDLPNGAVGVRIVRALGRSEDPADAATEVYEGTSTSFVDDTVTDHTIYSYFAFALDEDGVVHPSGVLDQIRPPGWADVAAGEHHSLAIANDGSLWAWGRNEHEQLGVATTELCTYYVSGSEFESPCALTPRRVGMATDWSEISAGGGHSLAVRTDGTMWAWGLSQDGQAGVATASVSTPTQIGADTTWTRVAAGATHSMALQDDGSLWVWGNGGWGQIGDGIGGNRSVPTLVVAAQPWNDFDAAGDSCMGLQADGTLWAWGRNLSGHLGDGTMDDLFIPTQIGSASNWSAVAMGAGFSTALREDGTVWAWGQGPGPNIASGSPVATLTPLQVGSAADWGAIFTGEGHVLALKRDGRMWGWGRNDDGEVGNGGGGDVFNPEPIGELTWSEVAAGLDHSLGITTNDGKLWLWGDNVFGQLGLGGQGSGFDDPYLAP